MQAFIYQDLIIGCHVTLPAKARGFSSNNSFTAVHLSGASHWHSPPTPNRDEYLPVSPTRSSHYVHWLICCSRAMHVKNQLWVSTTTAYNQGLCWVFKCNVDALNFSLLKPYFQEKISDIRCVVYLWNMALLEFASITHQPKVPGWEKSLWKLAMELPSGSCLPYKCSRKRVMGIY